MDWRQRVILSFLRYSAEYIYKTWSVLVSYYCDHTVLFQIGFPLKNYPFFFHMGRCYFSFHFFLTTYLQTYGSGNRKRVGVILQRGVLILLLACFPCWAVLINTQPILLAVRQSAEVAR